MFKSKMKILLIKEESSYGSDPTPTVAANAIQAENITTKYPPDTQERGYHTGDLSPVASVPGKKYLEISFDVEIKGSGTAGTAGRIGDMLEAAGMSETAAPGSSVTYLPSSGTMKSITAYVFEIPTTGSARLHKLTGGVISAAKLAADAGKIAKLSLTVRGIYNAPSDVTPPDTPTFESTVPPIVESLQFTINSIDSLILQKVELDFGIEVGESPNISSSGAIKSFQIIARKPKLKIAPEAVTIATYDWWTDFANATQRALSFVIGATAGNICTISCPAVGIESPPEITDRNGVSADDMTLACNRSAGNDEVSIIFT